MSWFSTLPIFGFGSSDPPEKYSTDADKIARARQVLAYYHNEAVKSAGYTLSFDELIAQINSLNPTFLKYFGQALGLVTTLSEADIQSAMVTLADQTSGAPGTASSLSLFFDALQSKADNWDLSKWSSVIAQATVDGAKQVAAVAAVGVGVYVAAVAIAFLIIATRKQ